jgi:hypothetical protein
MWFSPYLFLFAMVSLFKGMRANDRFREGSRSVIKNSPFSLRPRDPILLCDWNFGIRSRSAIETTGSDPAVSITPLDPLQWHLQILWILYKNFHVGFSGVIETTEYELCKQLSRKSQQIWSYMRNGLSPESGQGPFGDYSMKENRGSIILLHCPFKSPLSGWISVRTPPPSPINFIKRLLWTIQGKLYPYS